MNGKLLSDYIDSIVFEKGVPGCQCTVYVNHERVFYHSAGHRDVKGVEPVTPDDLYWIFSVTKLFTCVAAMQLAERGRLDPEAPVSRYLPSWSDDDVSRLEL